MDFLRAGRALVIRERETKVHLWLVLTDPDPQTDKVVIVMVTTRRDHSDPTVILQPGDHPFIRHASSVEYGVAKLAPRSKLEAGMARGRATLHEDVKPALLGRVRSGLLASSRTSHELKDYCRVCFPGMLTEPVTEKQNLGDSANLRRHHPDVA